ncbi:QcrA and Rieske domain-containing protein [Actinomarinicola tropica]|uniref:Uncharacterized protein n=1 Tax=Actinomarinicola tropica TaxID=2789776 RepID=A0A5Q2RTV6_9ACTN|nr:hypothetical protein [Actinomarinicola tropica]QGG96645.1 hypothetical protein GH723_16935 [Actinomarinicola tropica]
MGVHVIDAEDEEAERPPRRRTIVRLLAFVIAGAVVLALVMGATYLFVDLGEETDGRTALALPLLGDVVGATLDDGTAVWVVHDIDGDVRVLRARDVADESVQTHVWAVSYCPTTGRFESYWGAQFDMEGRRLGGPAPTGLGVYDVEVTDDDQVLVGTLATDDAGRAEVDEVGQPSNLSCDGEGPAIHHPLWEPL